MNIMKYILSLTAILIAMSIVLVKYVEYKIRTLGTSKWIGIGEQIMDYRLIINIFFIGIIIVCLILKEQKLLRYLLIGLSGLALYIYSNIWLYAF
jgi:hypothetical protein